MSVLCLVVCLCITVVSQTPINTEYKITRHQTTTSQPRFELIRHAAQTQDHDIPAHYSERIKDTRKQEFSFAIADYNHNHQSEQNKEEFIITRPSQPEKAELDDSPINFPSEGNFESKGSEEKEKLDLRTGSMVCCSCSKRYEDCPSQSNNFKIGRISNNQSESRNLSKRDIPAYDVVRNKNEEPVHWESDSSLNSHCPQSSPFPCFCYNTELQDAEEDRKSPAIDVHLSFDPNTEQFDVHRVHITKPSFDYDTLYCMRESLGNEEDEAKNATQESITTTTTPDDEEIGTPLKESEGYGLKALIKYKIKKVKNTWSNIKSLLNYGYER